MYVARFTYDPIYDQERNWSGWIDPTAPTPEALAEMLIEYGHVKLPARLENAYWDGDTEDAIQYVLENADIRLHEQAGLWMLVHHEGLSCWPLEAETLEEAIEEAKALAESRRIDWCGFGDRTVGSVRYVASVSDILHIFECDDVAPETDY